MAWRKKSLDLLADILRFSVRGAIMIDAILLALASIYVTAKFCFRLVEWLDRTLFASPWG